MYCPNGLLCWKRVCICVARYMCNASIPIWYLLNIFIVARDIVCYSIRWQCHGDLRSQPHPCIPIGLVSYFVCFCKHWTTCHTAYASSRLAVAAHSFQTTLFDECFVFQRWCFLLFVCLLLLVSMRSMALLNCFTNWMGAETTLWHKGQLILSFWLEQLKDVNGDDVAMLDNLILQRRVRRPCLRWVRFLITSTCAEREMYSAWVSVTVGLRNYESPEKLDMVVLYRLSLDPRSWIRKSSSCVPRQRSLEYHLRFATR